MPLDGGILGGARPEIGKRLALQQHDEQEDQAGKDREHHDNIENPRMDPSDGDSHQENADGYLACYRYEAVSNFAQPPILETVRMNSQDEIIEKVGIPS